jgi:diaminopimelate epimerase
MRRLTMAVATVQQCAGRARAATLDCRGVQFEKWQALGNDYLIVERAALPFELTPARVRKLCAPHTGVFADGVLLLEAPSEAGYVARLRIFNPDGSESGLSGNGAREAALYLRRRGWTDADTFSIQTGAGEIRPTLISPTTAVLDIGRVRTRSDDFPSGPADGAATLTVDGREWRFQHVQVGNPQAAIRVAGEPELAALDLPAIGGAIERHRLFPNRTNVSWYAPVAADRIRARIFERGVGETSASGTGATGAAVAHVLAGGDSPVTVVLDGGELLVAVEEDLHVTLSGWALPVFSGALAEDFIKELHETE